MQKIQNLFEKLKQPSKTSQDFKKHLFNNFFGDVDLTFKNEDHIEHVANICFSALCSYKKSENFFIVNNKFAEKQYSFCIVLQDRPFVTDSILSWIKSESLHPSVFIHPNLFFNQEISETSMNKKDGFEKYSIVYFEVPTQLSENQISALKYIIEEVYISTQDYPSMKEFLEQQIQNSSNTELVNFVKWLCDEAFIILGVSSNNFEKGVCKLERYSQYKLNYDKSFSDVIITKSPIISFVHKRDPIDIILINTGTNIIQIFGLFTTHSYRYKLIDIPIVRKKINEITKYADFQDVGYNRKELFSFLENLPREELFSMSSEFLYNVSVNYIESMTRGKTFIYSRQSTIFPLSTFIVFTPNTKFTMTIFRKVTTVLQRYFNHKDIIKTFSNTHSIDRVVMLFSIKTDGKSLTQEQSEKLDKEILEMCENSEDGLFEAIAQYDALIPSKIIKKYEDSFSAGYLTSYKSTEIAKDILFLEQLTNEKPCIVSVASHIGNDVSIKLYSNTSYSLHTIVQILEQCGITVYSEHPFIIKNSEIEYFVHDISGTINMPIEYNLTENKEFVNVVERALMKQISHTTLNKLSVTSNTSARDIYLTMSYIKYLAQIQFQYPSEVIHGVLAKYPKIFKKILELFYTKFEPHFTGDRNTMVQKINEETLELYSEIVDIVDDAILRQIYKLVEATVRTNFFLHKSYISLKFDCANIPLLPKPIPFREIFVYSIDFQATHLRFGKVARGGLRWSDRQSDFRTEVLGLVKAQNTKNAVIVPVGSKGGFVITKDVSNLSRDEYLEFGKFCYTQFLSGCLDLCDNIVQGNVITPQNIIKWEDEDPYFVVAADKGTATFSDLANSISAKYNFWLGDAFASGGSNGYDHKKMGITAKGAWIAVRRHFMEVGFDTQKTDFTCVGIGDMSGDVFGNGMLLSEHICLIGAFNHMHIFVDPNPDAKKSFAERKRLFLLPRSTWDDYDRNILSNGGMIYQRSEKVCKLTPEIQKRFGITQSEITPNELIVVLLKAEYDLLWNGGIGTYVKSSDEKNTEVGDKANNAIRVNGKDLRCKVIGEGGNLGMTQKGRIEYAQNGGKVNTDAMDNSAGVNSSDVEVNIKIVLNKIVDEDRLSLEQRNKILEEMTPEVEALVLRNNYLQTQAIGIASHEQSSKMEKQELLMQKLELYAHLDRENEYLPSSQEMHTRKIQKHYLTTPELCVIFAYSKIYLYKELLTSSLIEEKYFTNDLLSYFPKQMQERFYNDIINHKLSKEIIATSVNNSVVNYAGITFVSDVINELNCKPCDVVRAYIVIREIFNLRMIWEIIESLDYKVQYTVQIDLFESINQLIYKCTCLLLNKRSTKLPITEMVASLTPLVTVVSGFLASNEGITGINERKNTLKKHNIEDSSALHIAKTFEMMQLCQLILTNENAESLRNNINTYYNLLSEIPLMKIISIINDVTSEDNLEKIAIRELEEKLYNKYCALVTRVTQNQAGNVINWKQNKSKEINNFQNIANEVFHHKKPSFPLISMITDKIDTL